MSALEMEPYYKLTERAWCAVLVRLVVVGDEVFYDGDWRKVMWSHSLGSGWYLELDEYGTVSFDYDEELQRAGGWCDECYAPTESADLLCSERCRDKRR